MELQLIEELGGVATEHVQLVEVRQLEVLRWVRNAEAALQPDRVDDQVLQGEGVGLGHGVVPQAALGVGEPPVGVGEVLGVDGLVEKGPVIVLAPVRADDQHDFVRDAYGRAKGPRRLARPRLGIQVNVVLALCVDPQLS